MSQMSARPGGCSQLSQKTGGAEHLVHLHCPSAPDSFWCLYVSHGSSAVPGTWGEAGNRSVFLSHNDSVVDWGHDVQPPPSSGINKCVAAWVKVPSWFLPPWQGCAPLWCEEEVGGFEHFQRGGSCFWPEANPTAHNLWLSKPQALVLVGLS